MMNLENSLRVLSVKDLRASEVDRWTFAQVCEKRLAVWVRFCGTRSKGLAWVRDNPQVRFLLHHMELEFTDSIQNHLVIERCSDVDWHSIHTYVTIYEMTHFTGVNSVRLSTREQAEVLSSNFGFSYIGSNFKVLLSDIIDHVEFNR